MHRPNISLRDWKTHYCRLLANRRINIGLDKPVISITFDDVPRSAYENGLPVLDSFGIKATFYVAMGLTDSSSRTAGETDEYSEYLTHQDIIDLHRFGHDIACHTYSHYMLETGSPECLLADAEKNTKALESLLGNVTIEHFSYPFGQVNFKLKRLLSKKYKSMRSTRPGVNDSATDLNLLLAMSIYDRGFSKTGIVSAIELAARAGGWLVFYTHGVTSSPGKFDCTPEQLSWVIECCRQSDARLLPVSAAYEEVVARCG